MGRDAGGGNKELGAGAVSSRIREDNRAANRGNTNLLAAGTTTHPKSVCRIQPRENLQLTTATRVKGEAEAGGDRQS